MKKVFYHAALRVITLVVIALLLSMGAFAAQIDVPVPIGRPLPPSFKNAVDLLQVKSGAEAAFEVKSVSLKLNGSNIGAFLKPGQEVRLSVTVKYSGWVPDDYIKSVYFVLSDLNVASIRFKENQKQSGFYVTPLKEGNTIINVVVGGKSGSVLLCSMKGFGKGITLNMNDITIARSQSVGLMAMQHPKTKPISLTWTSSNNEVATVSKNGVVTAHSIGTADIIATKKKQSARCAVTVVYGGLPEPDHPTNLRMGSEGSEVERLQNRLIDLFYMAGKADGTFDVRTYRAVNAIRRTLGLADTGVADAETRAYLYSSGAQKKSLAVGDLINLGQFEQNNSSKDGLEPIEWRVLAVEGDKVLIISKDCIDSRAFNDKLESVTWSSCTLRQWLNGDFYTNAFSRGERERIMLTTLENPDNFGTDGGPDTQDHVFLLSSPEAKRLFKSNSARKAWPSIYAIDRGVYTRPSDGTCRWWLRSPGTSPMKGAGVGVDGSVGRGGGGPDVNYQNNGIRPALWLRI